MVSNGRRAAGSPFNSSVRAWTAKARDVVPGSAVLSMTRTVTPSFVSQSARTKPVGPAPTIKTSLRAISTPELVAQERSSRVWSAEDRAAALQTGGRPQYLRVVIAVEDGSGFRQRNPRQLRPDIDMHVWRQRRGIVEGADT